MTWIWIDTPDSLVHVVGPGEGRMKDRIREIREHYGLYQAQFAQRINKSPGFISLVETGRSNLSRAVVERICAIYGVDEAWLVDGKGEMTDKAPVDMENIGVRLKAVRKDKKMTQMQFSSAIGYSKLQICFIDIGMNNTSDELIHKVVSVFEVNLEWHLTGKGEMYSSAPEKLDDELARWLNEHPEMIRELRRRSELEKKKKKREKVEKKAKKI